MPVKVELSHILYICIHIQSYIYIYIVSDVYLLETVCKIYIRLTIVYIYIYIYI